ncbi:MAG: cell division protein ZapA [Limnobacter sp.]|nr:cell division protein ZapA [Limnobacter sp.]
MNTLEVKILGREYRFACKPEEKTALLRAVNILETKMAGIRDTGRVVGVDKIAVMAALQITHESLLGSPNSGQPALELDIETLERKIDSIDQLADQALASAKAGENGHLF